MRIKYVTLAKLVQKVKRNKINGLYDRTATDVAVLNKTHGFNFDKEFNKYIELNYGDILTDSDIEHLKRIVYKYYSVGKIQNTTDLHKYVRFLGKKHNLIFD